MDSLKCKIRPPSRYSASPNNLSRSNVLICIGLYILSVHFFFVRNSLRLASTGSALTGPSSCWSACSLNSSSSSSSSLDRAVSRDQVGTIRDSPNGMKFEAVVRTLPMIQFLIIFFCFFSQLVQVPFEVRL